MMSLADVAQNLSDLRFHDPPYGEFTIARILKESEGRWTPLFRGVRRGFAGIGNILDSRSKLYRYLGVGSDEEAYEKLLNALERPGGLERVSAWRDVYREVESLYDLPMVRYY